jgi:hypothetical protein
MKRRRSLTSTRSVCSVSVRKNEPKLRLAVEFITTSEHGRNKRGIESRKVGIFMAWTALAPIPRRS